MTLTPEVLAGRDFGGSVPFSALPAARIPQGGGVYVVVRTADRDPVFTATSAAG